MNNNIKKWIDDHIDKEYLRGKTVLVTGGNSGIALEASKAFIYLGMHVIWANRNLEKSKAVINDQLSLANITLFKLDLSSLESVENFVKELEESHLKVDFVYNNAGVYNLDESYTKDGMETVMETNFIATYYLNELLLESFTLRGMKCRFIFTTSLTHRLVRLDLNDLFMEKGKYKKGTIYGRSKLALIHSIDHLSDKYSKAGYSFAILHPGAVYTPLIEKGYKNPVFKKAASLFMRLVFHKADKAALTAIACINDKENFAYYVPRGLFSISGYPKKGRLTKKALTDYEKTVAVAEEYINSVKNKNL